MLHDFALRLRRERSARQAAEQLLNAVTGLVHAENRDDIFDELVHALRPIVNFEDAALLVADDHRDRVLSMRCVASASGALLDTRWEPIRVFHRVLENVPVAAFDVGQIPEWTAAVDPVELGIRSALHVPILGGERPGILLCLHSKRGAFKRDDVRVARRITPVASQALLNIDRLELIREEAQQRTAAEEARAATDTLSRAMRSLGVGVALIGADDHPQDHSQTLEQMISAWPHPDEWWARVRDRLGTLRLEEDQKVTVELDVPDGTVRVYEFTSGGSVNQGHTALLLVSEVTRWKQAQDALVEARDEALRASRAKSAFLANMSHELRTPLNAILGYAELVADEALEAGMATAVKDVSKITEAGERLLATVDGVLDLSRIEAGAMNVDRVPFRLEPVLDALVARFRPLAQAKKTQIVVQTTPEATRALGDTTRYRQALRNLLSNAVKFTDGGRITVTTHLVEDDGETWVATEVGDTGIGIDSDDIARLLRPFSQADSSMARQFEGTGLGLTLAHRLCQLMGGRLTARGKRGEGARFTIQLRPIR